MNKQLESLKVSDALLEAERVQNLVGGVPAAAIGNILVAATVIWPMWDIVSASVLLAWYGFVVIVQLARLTLFAVWRRPAETVTKQRWLTFLRIGALLSGLTWGLIPVFFFPESLTHQVFLTLSIVGINAAALSGLSYDRTSLLLFSIPASVPLITSLLTESGELPLALGVLITMFLIYLIVAGQRSSNIFRNMLALREKIDSQNVAMNQAQAVSHLGSFDWDLVSGSLQWSDEHFRLWGLTPNSVTPDSALYRNSIHPDDIAHVESSLRLAVPDDPNYECKYRVIWPDGSEHHVHGRGEVTFNDAGQAIQVVGTTLDITILIKSEERLNFALEGSGDGVWDWDLQTGDLNFSKKGVEMFGYADNDIGNTIAEWHAKFAPEDQIRWNDAIRKLFREKKEKITLESRIRCKDGSYKWVLTRGKVSQRSAEGIVLRMIGIHSDITPRKIAEDELRTARDEAEQANLAKSEFLSRMSHELRTPLNAILGFGQLLEQDTDTPLSQGQTEYVSQILSGGNHLLALVNEILDLSRIESGRLDVTIKSIELTPLINACVSQIKPLSSKRNISIAQEIDAVYNVQADYTRLKQVLLNLLSNAVKYNKYNGNILISCKATGGDLRISVQDTGYGIADEHLSKLFQPFERLPIANQVVEGSGIGLALAKNLVEAMQGEIGVNSMSGEGSTFWFELPLTAPDSSPQQARLID